MSAFFTDIYKRPFPRSLVNVGKIASFDPVHIAMEVPFIPDNYFVLLYEEIGTDELNKSIHRRCDHLDPTLNSEMFVYLACK